MIEKAIKVVSLMMGAACLVYVVCTTVNFVGVAQVDGGKRFIRPWWNKRKTGH